MRAVLPVHFVVVFVPYSHSPAFLAPRLLNHTTIPPLLSLPVYLDTIPKTKIRLFLPSLSYLLRLSSVDKTML
jgi:hypothetical protein